MSPHGNYDLPENVTPILDTEQDIFSKLRETRKEPVIKLHRLTENVSFETLNLYLTTWNSLVSLGSAYPLGRYFRMTYYSEKYGEWKVGWLSNFLLKLQIASSIGFDHINLDP